MITPEYIRTLIQNRNTILANIIQANKGIIRIESENEIIEGIVLHAQIFEEDRVQKDYNLDTIVEIIGRIRKEKKQQFYDISQLNMIVEAKKNEIEYLDSLVYRLSPDLQAIIISRYYGERLSLFEVRIKLKEEYHLYYSEESIRLKTRAAIKHIAEGFNKRGLGEIPEY